MTMPLMVRRREAAGNPEGALVLFHGRGADENDLFPLLDALDPDRRLLGFTPRGPLLLPPGGAHWYIVPRVGYPDPETFLGSTGAVSEWLATMSRESGMPMSRVILGGFSQGAVMAHTMTWSKGAIRPAALVAFSGFIPEVDGWAPDFGPPHPRVAIGHGTFDPVIPVQFGRAAKARLEGAGVEVLYRESSMQHSIDPEFVASLVAWVREVVP